MVAQGVGLRCVPPSGLVGGACMATCVIECECSRESLGPQENFPSLQSVLPAGVGQQGDDTACKLSSKTSKRDLIVFVEMVVSMRCVGRLMLEKKAKMAEQAQALRRRQTVEDSPYH